ncbi:MAG: gamma-glutamyltransferase [Betaproteobacteria bacterium RIFCSPLOWO2_02_FULL_67_19]|nr:MAG: gamma-glutamyltransferase [Betaproteobacteria bacterium RIFCSPLOWO2_02_FULL_67_19]
MTAFSWALPYSWPRKPLLAQNVVATSQPLAAQAGLQMLAAGGNAVDAILATAITLTLVEPVSNGIGSDAFAILWDGKQLHGLNASGRAPAGWSTDFFSGRTAMPARGWNTVTVPGCVSAWRMLSERFGKLPFEQLFGPAIRYGRDGFLVSPTIAGQWAKQIAELREQPGFAQAFMPQGRAPLPGERFRFPEHAATLEKIAATRGEAFYRGELAERIAAHARQHGGVMTAADLAAHASDWTAPLSMDYRGYTLHELPPNGQGIVALIALGILQHFEMASHAVDGTDSLHLQIEAQKLAFADARRFVADLDHMDIRPQQLLDPGYLKQRAQLIDLKRAQDFGHGTPPQGGTVYLTAADASGMMISYIQSNYMGFGSGVVVPGTGISLQNRGGTFVVRPGHPNCVGPRKRPFQTIIPGFVTRNGQPVMSFGVMGGSMQPQGHAQVMVRIADYGQNPQTACDGPRFRLVQGIEVSVEGGFPPASLAELQRRGHRIVTVDDYNQFGSAQLIWKLDGGYFAASDPRRDGQAVGF